MFYKEESKIHLFSLNYLHLNDVENSNFTISDIVIGLAREQRFTGQSFHPKSVLSHIIDGYEKLTYEKFKRLGGEKSGDGFNDFLFQWLMHDIAEAFIKDIPQPIKKNFPSYEKVEERILKAASKKYGFKYPFSTGIIVLDNEDKEVPQEDKPFIINEPEKEMAEKIRLFIEIFDNLTGWHFMDESAQILKQL
jgi:hypothetical protein